MDKADAMFAGDKEDSVDDLLEESRYPRHTNGNVATFIGQTDEKLGTNSEILDDRFDEDDDSSFDDEDEPDESALTDS